MLPRVGAVTLILNCSVALCLNISVVFLIGCASSLVLTLSGALSDIAILCIDPVRQNDKLTMLW